MLRCLCWHVQALWDLLQGTSQAGRTARWDILSILARPRIPAAAAAVEGSVETTDKLIKELCAAEVSLRHLAKPLQPSIGDWLRLLDLMHTLAGSEPDSVRLFKVRSSLGRQLSVLGLQLQHNLALCSPTHVCACLSGL